MARQKLSKDLDLTTYLRTVNKVKGIVQCALDDKQRLMLKYNQHRIVCPNLNKAAEHKANQSVITTANVIYEKFTEQGTLRRDDDFRFLLGLGYTWGSLIPNEFKPSKPATVKPKKHRTQASLNPQDNAQQQDNQRYSAVHEQEPDVIADNSVNIAPLDPTYDPNYEINKTIEDFQLELEANEKRKKSPIRSVEDLALGNLISADNYKMNSLNFLSDEDKDALDNTQTLDNSGFKMIAKRRNTSVREAEDNV